MFLFARLMTDHLNDRTTVPEILADASKLPRNLNEMYLWCLTAPTPSPAYRNLKLIINATAIAGLWTESPVHSRRTSKK